jgi:DNA repair protein RecO (recombination protein O)
LTPPALFAGFRFSPQTLREGGMVTAEALRPHLPRPLKSLLFLERMLAVENPAQAG